MKSNMKSVLAGLKVFLYVVSLSIAIGFGTYVLLHAEQFLEMYDANR